MSIDMDQFKETFITESFELLEEMEELLLSLDEDDLDKVNAIFRCAHSIKGGAGAFGFDRLVSFTHILEALLDAMREGKLSATTEVIDSLLQSVDVVHSLVVAAQEGRVVEESFGKELADKLHKIASDGGVDDSAAPAQESVADASESKTEKFSVKFTPHHSLFATGNEPLLILRELMRSGEVEIKVDYSAIPNIDKFDTEQCYLKWEMNVTTDEGIDAVYEAFEFVEDECDLEIENLGAVDKPAGDDFVEDDSAGLFDDALDDIEANRKEDDFVEDESAGLFDDALDKIHEAASEEIKSAAATVAPVAEVKKPEADTKAPAAKASVGVSSIRVDIDKVDNLVNMVGELVITQAMIVNSVRDFPQEQFSSLLQGVDELSRHTRGLQEAVMSVRMQPVKSVFARMPRIVRDLSAQLNKDIKIEMSGEATEIDKTVIEQLGDPLTHMIRNSADHGIETPDVREKNGKPRQGTINLSADNTGGRIIIEISDDGAGINREIVLAKAVEKGVVAPDAHLSDEEIDHLIFAAGFSTAAEVTNVSGRGVGMDVVRRNIQELGGSIELENNPGQGSRFMVSLPLTLAILDGMIIRVGVEEYIIPVNNILESISHTRDEIKNVADGADVINVRGEFVPILYLNEIFNIEKDKTDMDRVLVVLVESGRNKYGLVVDELLGQQQVVIKSIEENSEPIEGVSGATILGNGKVSFILDVAGLQSLSASDNVNNKKSIIAA